MPMLRTAEIQVVSWYGIKGNTKTASHQSKKEKTTCGLKLTSILENNRDVYLCAVYIQPSNSPYYVEEDFKELQKEISHFQTLGSILLCGDLNARTGREPDFIDMEGNRHIFGQNPLYQTYITTQRQSYDSVVNKIGKQVLQMCKGLGLYIVNGRIRGDSLGRFTYCSVLGSSVVDYSITDIEPGYINAFVVLPQLPISDHSQTILYLKKSVTHTEKTNIQPNLFPLPRTYKWSEHSNNDYTAALCCDEIQYMVDTFLITQYQPNRKGMNLATRDLNIFIQLAKKSKLKISRSRKTSTKQKEKWFDRECASSKKNLRKLSNKDIETPMTKWDALNTFRL